MWCIISSIKVANQNQRVGKITPPTHFNGTVINQLQICMIGNSSYLQ